MEYRQRRRTMQTPYRRGTLPGAALCILLVSAAVIYLVGFSNAGTWVAEHLVAPVFSTLGVGDGVLDGGRAEQPDQGTAAAATSKLLELPALSCHALQMGVYSTQDNAENQSAALQALGAAGYIMKEEDRYRVLAAAYTSDSDLQQVRDRLQTEGLDSAAYTMSSQTSKLIVSGTETQVAALQNILSGLIEMQKELCTYVIDFDREQYSVSEGKASIASLNSKAESYLAQIAAASSDQAVLVSLTDCCRAIQAQLAKAQALSEEDRAAFTAYLKYTCLLMADAYCGFCSEISGLSSN